MKNKRIALSLVLVAISGNFCIQAYKKYAYASSSISHLLEMNVEALATKEGTPVGDCYTSGQGGSSDFVLQCDENTTPSMIYPCPSNTSYIRKGVRGTCTK